jgi:hypothetical protein
MLHFTILNNMDLKKENNHKNHLIFSRYIFFLLILCILLVDATDDDAA